MLLGRVIDNLVETDRDQNIKQNPHIQSNTIELLKFLRTWLPKRSIAWAEQLLCMLFLSNKIEPIGSIGSIEFGNRTHQNIGFRLCSILVRFQAVFRSVWFDWFNSLDTRLCAIVIPCECENYFRIVREKLCSCDNLWESQIMKLNRLPSCYCELGNTGAAHPPCYLQSQQIFGKSETWPWHATFIFVLNKRNYDGQFGFATLAFRRYTTIQWRAIGSTSAFWRLRGASRDIV